MWQRVGTVALALAKAGHQAAGAGEARSALEVTLAKESCLAEGGPGVPTRHRRHDNSKGVRAASVCGDVALERSA